ncbi:DHA2 family efflux MFS transporter permease subunit [Nocardioides sp. BP30]|uniref:DHA2 family efflux MFS transporter permease subunit n=1 Tax=Nocardioides sp. BP30 TaxID=3036374 RepID=UPI0024687FC2|nr:DHA2 family efflux MFS transporter permease subunit [Nocardioides sp. BP30]WGL52639.1 DHA2 family efflux MFS transporter permease subunit [Nocardioides sp. BP30]
MTTDLSTEAASGSSDKLDARVLVIAGVVVLGSIMSILDITVVNVAMATFMKAFGKTQAQVAWVATGYTLALATVIPMTGWAAERFGTKRLYMLAILLFALGSALCATAPNLETLIVFRVLQGLGGGMLMPLGMTILTRAAGPERVGRVMAVLGVPMLLGPILGPILGGWLIDVASWHWIFLVNVPLGAIALVYAWRALDKDNPQSSESFDFVGMLLLSPGLACFLYGVSSIPAAQANHGTMWTGNVIIPAVLGLLLVIAFVPWALRRANIHPLLDLRLFLDRNMTVSVIAITLFAIAFFGASLLLPTYFQEVRGSSPLKSGVLLAPQGIGAMITMPVAGVLADKLGAGKVVIPGIVLIAVSMGMWIPVSDTTSTPYLLGALFIMGLGMGCTMMPIYSAAMATLRDHTIARGSTLMNIVQQIAASIGTALFSVLLTNYAKNKVTVPATDPSWAGQMADSFGAVFVVATILVAVVLIPAFFLPRSKSDEVGAGTPVVMH